MGNVLNWVRNQALWAEDGVRNERSGRIEEEIRSGEATAVSIQQKIDKEPRKMAILEDQLAGWKEPRLRSRELLKEKKKNIENSINDQTKKIGEYMRSSHHRNNFELKFNALSSKLDKSKALEGFYTWLDPQTRNSASLWMLLEAPNFSMCL